MTTSRCRPLTSHPAAGFTLVELLIAMFILAMGLVFVFSLYPVGIYTAREGVDDTRSALVARSALSRISTARVIDGLDTTDWSVLMSTAADAPGSLLTPADGFTAADIIDTAGAGYAWLASYARLDPSSSDVDDTNPGDALAVHIAVLRVSAAAGPGHLLNNSDFNGALVLVAGDRDARIISRPANLDGFVTPNYVHDVRSGEWYRIRDIRDTGDGGAPDLVVLDREARLDSDGTAFDNVRFFPDVVTVLDSIIAR